MATRKADQEEAFPGAKPSQLHDPCFIHCCVPVRPVIQRFVRLGHLYCLGIGDRFFF